MGNLKSLEGFRLTRILNSDAKTKAIDVLGRCGTGSLKSDLRSVEEQMKSPLFWPVSHKHTFEVHDISCATIYPGLKAEKARLWCPSGAGPLMRTGSPLFYRVILT